MKTRVVVAEDDPAMQVVIRVALTRAGFELVMVGDGARAVERVREHPPDAVLLDWHMPEMDGPTACQALKSDPATRDIPVVFLTARADPGAAVWVADLGAVGFLAKPFDPRTLGEQLRQLLTTADH